MGTITLPDANVQYALLPIESRTQFLEVSGDIMEHVDPVFYGDPKAAARDFWRSGLASWQSAAPSHSSGALASVKIAMVGTAVEEEPLEVERATIKRRAGAGSGYEGGFSEVNTTAVSGGQRILVDEKNCEGGILHCGRAGPERVGVVGTG